MCKNVLKQYKGEPLLNIKIAESRQFIDFETNGSFSIFDQNDNKIAENVSSDAKWRLKIESFESGQSYYSFLLSVHNDKNNALKIIKKLKKRGLIPHLQEIGGLIKIGDVDIINKKYQILIGEFNSPEQLLNIDLTGIYEFNPLVRCEKIRKPKATYELCDENFNLAYKIDNSFYIIPEESKTKTIFYNVTDNNPEMINKCIIGAFGFSISENQMIDTISFTSLESYIKNILLEEMSACNHLEVLKSQAVITRSSIVANLGILNYNENHDIINFNYNYYSEDSDKFILIIDSILADTKGQVLFYNNELCDPPYCECCGGYLDNEYSSPLYSIPSYINSGLDTDSKMRKKISLKSEKKLIKWFDSQPDVLCNPLNKDSKNNFKWNLSLTREKLEKNINLKIEDDIGFLFDIIPLNRTISGKINKIEIIGSKKNVTISNENDIRRIIYDNKLPSCRFIIEREIDDIGITTKFNFRGSGKGHCAGLCQSGAESLAKKNKNYKDLLNCYYNNVFIKKIY